MLTDADVVTIKNIDHRLTARRPGRAFADLNYNIREPTANLIILYPLPPSLMRVGNIVVSVEDYQRDQGILNQRLRDQEDQEGN